MGLRRAFRIGLALVAAVALMLPSPLAAARGDSRGAADVEVIAEGQRAARSRLWPREPRLYVAEAGAGGQGPCAEQPILADACFGKSGAITRIDRKGAKTAVKNLGSIAGPLEGLGPHDVSLHGRRMAFSVGFAGTPELRALFGGDAERSLGFLMTSPTKGGHRRGNVSGVADLVAYEGDVNPDGGAVDSNPYGVLAQGKWTYVAVAGAFGKDGSLYVLEIAHNNLLAENPEGAVIKVDPSGAREIVADGLFFPGGLALGKKGELYVTNCGICFEDGEVLRINP
jgi:hypothetical protein